MKTIACAILLIGFLYISIGAFRRGDDALATLGVITATIWFVITILILL